MPEPSALTPFKPQKIDPSDGPCRLCAGLGKQTVSADGKPAHACDDCGCPIPAYPGMDGNGYESQTYHLHLKPLEGKVAWDPVCRELCRDCYRKDYQVIFPGSPDPV